MGSFWREIKHVLLGLKQDRTFSLVVLLTLALVIGVNTTIFSVVNTVLLSPLPFPESNRLVATYNAYPKVGVTVGSNSVPDYLDRRKMKDTFEAVALLNHESANLGVEGTPERMVALYTTPEIFTVLKTAPLLGRTFSEEESQIGKEQVVMLTESLWQRLFARDPGVVGKSLTVNGRAYTVIGVAPDSIDVLRNKAKLILPFAFTDQQKSDDSRHSNFADLIGRLAPGVSATQAQTRVDAFNQRLLEQFPQFKQVLENVGFRSVVKGLQDLMVEDVRPSLYLLQAGVLLVLLIGCVNIANLVLVRSNRRRSELGVRMALGAGRSSLARQLITESLVLTFAGALLGLGLSQVGLQLLIQLGLSDLPRASEISIDGSSVLFALALAGGSGLIFGLIPMLRVASGNLVDVFRQGSRTGTATRRTLITRSTLVVAQVVLAFLLATGAGLLLSSFRKAVAVSPGFDPKGVLTAQLALPKSRYDTDAKQAAAIAALTTRLGTLPGVAAAAATSNLPFSGNNNASVVSMEGYVLKPGENPPVPHFHLVTPGYFQALNMPLLAGRAFTESDIEGAPKVVMIDQNLAARFWPGQSPVGKRLRQGLEGVDGEDKDKQAEWLTIVGVVPAIKTYDLTEKDDVGSVYFPMLQFPTTGLALLLRTTGAPESLTPAVRKAVLEVDSELPIFDVMTQQARIDRSLVERRAPMVLFSAFAVLALLLASIGLYGVLAYVVQQRRKELGVRSALGAEPGRLLKLVLSQGSLLVGVGLLLGLAGALASRKLLAGLLFEVRPGDPGVLGLTAFLLAAVGLAACLEPSLRAARTNPVVALKED
ncbi:MAG: ABC transporter permease [Thermoanaerobaculia bacterium]